MRANFDDQGNLILEPDNNLERMACGHFVSALHRRNKPQVLVAGAPVAPTVAGELDRLNADLPGQQNLKDVV